MIVPIAVNCHRLCWQMEKCWQMESRAPGPGRRAAIERLPFSRRSVKLHV